MFIKNKSDVDLYAKNIYAYIISSKSKEYVKFIQNLLNQKQEDKIEEVFGIVIADIYDYFCEHVNSCESMYIYENLSVREINESEYINDEIFVEYTIESLKKKKISNINLYYLIKSILLSIKDVNSNILYALRYNKNKDANIHIKYIISKYTNAQIKVTANVLSKIQVKSKKSITINEFYELYENYKQNQIKKFEFENEVNYIREKIKLTHKDLLVYYYLLSFSKRFVKTKIEEIARDCKISTATVSRAIKKLEKARKIKIHKIKNKNIYEILNYEIIKHEERQTQQKQQIVKTEKQKEYRKVNISRSYKDVKNIETQTSELDYKRYRKNEKIEKETRYKLYLYRMKYREELENTKLKRLTKDDALFFLINTENLVESLSLTIDQVLKIIKYADSNPKIESPVGWLIARFMIGRGRFYFLLSKSKLSKSNENSNYSQKHEYKHNKDQPQPRQRQIRIREDLLYFAQKYNISEKDIMSYLSRINVHGDVSYVVEMYLSNRLWKNILPREKKQELISYAKRQISKFVVPPKPEEVKNTIKSIILGEIRSRYLTLSIEEKIKMKNASQCYDTS